MRIHIATISGMLALALVAGCKKKDKDSSSSGKPSDKGAAAANLPPLTAEPDITGITPADKPPFEAVKFQMLAKRGDNGWPEFNAYNLGTKKVAFMAVYGYAYDKDGKQVAKTGTPLSWNGSLDAGGKTDWTLHIGMPDDHAPASAVTFQACYTDIKFDGDTAATTDASKCPDQRPLAK